MKKIIIALLLVLSFASISVADEWVNGYYRSDGSYVTGHYRSDPDGNTSNNYSYPGNYNPYTGRVAPIPTPTPGAPYYSNQRPYYDDKDSTQGLPYQNTQRPYYDNGN